MLVAGIVLVVLGLALAMLAPTAGLFARVLVFLGFILLLVWLVMVVADDAGPHESLAGVLVLGRWRLKRLVTLVAVGGYAVYAVLFARGVRGAATT